MGIERYRLSGFRLSMAGGAIVAVIAALLPAQSVLAQVAAAPDTVYEFNIPAGELAKALDAFSAQAGVQIGYTPELVAEKQARALRERLNWREGLGKLLEGSGLEYQQIKAGTVVVKRSKESRTQEKMQPVNTSRDTAAASGNATVTEIDSVTVTGLESVEVLHHHR